VSLPARSDFVSKPFATDQVVDRLGALLAGRPQGRPEPRR
jgi:hypothetical protein